MFLVPFSALTLLVVERKGVQSYIPSAIISLDLFSEESA